MANRWSLKEDIIICKYCTENPWAYSSDVEIEEMMSRLDKAGCAPRSFGAIRKRAYAYEILRERRQISNMPEQVINVYEAFESRNICPDKYQRVQSYIRETYNPPQSSNVLEDQADSLLELVEDSHNLLGYLHTIDFQSTFPMVLQKYVDLKGVKKHTGLCKTIGMKPDTFSAILRGKYKEVKKDNILRLCVGLQLTVNEAEELLNSAGYMLSNAIITDVVVKAFLSNRVYSAVAINVELYENNAPLLFQDYVID